MQIFMIARLIDSLTTSADLINFWLWLLIDPIQSSIFQVLYICRPCWQPHEIYQSNPIQSNIPIQSVAIFWHLAASLVLVMTQDARDQWEEQGKRHKSTIIGPLMKMMTMLLLMTMKMTFRLPTQHLINQTLAAQHSTGQTQMKYMDQEKYRYTYTVHCMSVRQIHIQIQKQNCKTSCQLDRVHK